MKNNFVLTVKAIIIKDDKFLILRRSKKEMEKSRLSKNRCWDLAGGGVKFSETVVDALLREICEETQLDVDIHSIFSCYDVIKKDIHMSILTYICIYKNGEVILSDEHDDFYWLTIDEMKDFKIPKWMIRDFKKAYKVYTEKQYYDKI